MFEFISESKAFRNEKAMENYSVAELSEIFFTMLLTLHLLGLTRFIRETDAYALDSVKYPMFDRIYLSGTDLCNVIATLKNAKEYLDERDVSIPVLELKRYLKNFKYDTMPNTMKRTLFIKLQSILKIKNNTLISLRRDIVDSGEYLTWSEKKQKGDRLYQQLRKQNYRCDVLVLLQKLMDTNKE